MADDFLNEQTRAEDILLGALGFDSDARLLEVRYAEVGFAGVAAWSDGEQFEFESDDELTEMERWAIEILTGNTGNGKKA